MSKSYIDLFEQLWNDYLYCHSNRFQRKDLNCSYRVDFCCSL